MKYHGHAVTAATKVCAACYRGHWRRRTSCMLHPAWVVSGAPLVRVLRHSSLEALSTFPMAPSFQPGGNSEPPLHAPAPSSICSSLGASSFPREQAALRPPCPVRLRTSLPFHAPLLAGRSCISLPRAPPTPSLLRLPPSPNPLAPAPFIANHPLLPTNHKLLVLVGSHRHARKLPG